MLDNQGVFVYRKKMKMEENESTGAVRVEKTLKTRIKCRSEELSVSMQEFVSLSCLYVLRSGIDPSKVEKQEGLDKEMAKMRSQIFGFMKKQEIDFVKPMAQAMQEVRIRINEIENTQKAIQLLAFKNKIMQEIQLSASYKLSNNDEDFIKNLSHKMQIIFDEEVEKFTTEMR